MPIESKDQRRGSLGDVAAVAFLAVFFGVFNGFLLLGTLSAYGPVSTTAATLERLDISSTSNSNRSAGPTRWVEGTTDDGRSWRFASREIYGIARTEGYPMAVEVTFSDWAGVVIGVQGESFAVERRGMADRLVLPGLFVLATAGALLALVLVGRRDRGLAVAVVLVVGFAVGTWLGLPLGRWVRS